MGPGAPPPPGGLAFNPDAPTAWFASRRWRGDGYRWVDRAYPIPPGAGCPPGLVPFRDGCAAPGDWQPPGPPPPPTPPGVGWANWYPAPYWQNPDAWTYRDGYLYRYADADGGNGLGRIISAFIPLIGGALFGGNPWPQQVRNYAVPDYYDRFYGSGYRGDYDFRYADDAIFAVDPASGRIDSIAGLLTGDDWAVGRPMPPGYDLYNVPMPYRDRYADGPDHWYRYSDGYVYDVDPTTQLVRAVIQLLA